MLTSFSCPDFVTKEGAVTGTPEYMSPEQVRGDPVDARSDLYACGVLLYTMLTGETPYYANSDIGHMLEHLSATVPDPRQVVPGLSAVVSGAVMRCLAKDPADRPQSARELRAELKSGGGTAPTMLVRPARREIEPTEPALERASERRREERSDDQRSADGARRAAVAPPAGAGGRLQT